LITPLVDGAGPQSCLYRRMRQSGLQTARGPAPSAGNAASSHGRIDNGRAVGSVPNSERRRRSDIQGLRALAIVLVVAFHVQGGLPGGFVGVDMFFAVSGFVITSTLVRELHETGTVSLSGFYARRVKRLLPGLAVMLAFVAVVGVFLTPVAATYITAF